MKKFLFRLWQWTWGFPQSLLGLIFRLVYRDCPRTEYRNTVVTHWPKGGSMGVGMYLFLGTGGDEDHKAQVLVHEFGHSVQSMTHYGYPLFSMGQSETLQKTAQRKRCLLL